MAATVEAGAILVRVLADAKGLISGLQRAQQSIQNLGRNVSAIGGQLTTGLTLPIGLVAGASAKFAADFEAELTKIITLVGVAEGQVNQWREEILRMAPAVGRGPGELARALFFVTSAGERGADALKIVRRAAEGSAAGLGDTATIAKTVTAAMQAYQNQGLNAAQAQDVLTATVRQGSVEAEELSGALGRVLGVASELGVGFDEVGGFVASFTRVGVNAREAVTGLRGILNALLQDNPDQIAAMRELGLTMDQLRAMVDEKGLARTLVDLIDKFGGNNTALRKLIPRVRALAATLSTARSQGQQFVDITDRVSNALGITREAFDITQRTIRQKFARLFARLQVTAIRIGDSLVGALEKIVDILEPVIQGIGKWADMFSKLNPKIKGAIENLLIFTVTIGPVLFILGQMVTAVGALVGVFALLTGSLGVGGAIVAGLAALAGGLGIATFQMGKAEIQAEKLGSKLDEIEFPKFENVILADEKTLKDQVKTFEDEVSNLEKEVADTKDKLEEPIERSPIFGIPKSGELQKQAKLEEELAQAIGKLATAYDNLTLSRARLNIKRRQNIAAEESAAEAEALRRLEEKSKAIKQLIGRLKQERDELILTRRERINNTLAANDATEEERKRANALLKTIQVIENNKRVQKEHTDAVRNANQVLERRRQLALQLGQIDRRSRIQSINRALEEQNLSINRQLSLEEERAQLVSQVVSEQISNARRVARESTNQAINELRRLKAFIAQAFPEGGAPDLQRRVDTAISGIRNQAETQTKDLSKRLERLGVSAGTSLVQGIATGAQDAEEIIKTAVINFIVRVIEAAIFAQLGIASPSKKARIWGRAIGEGMALGIKDSSRLVKDASNQLALSATPTGFSSTRRLGRPVSGVIQSSRGGAAALLREIKDASRGDPVLAALKPEFVQIVGRGVKNYIDRGGRIQ